MMAEKRRILCLLKSKIFSETTQFFFATDLEDHFLERIKPEAVYIVSTLLSNILPALSRCNRYADDMMLIK